MATEENRPTPDKATGAAFPWKLVVVAGLLLTLALLYVRYGSVITLKNLARQETQLKSFAEANPLIVYGAAFLIYVAVTGLSLPGAAALSLMYAWFFDFWPAIVLISFASTLGATLAFLLSRYLLRDSLEAKFGDRLQGFNEALEREGAFYLFTLRLIPAVPFFVINLVMGLTRIRLKTYWWVSQVGMLPGTFVYVYAGNSVPSLQKLADEGIGAVFTPRQITSITIAFVLLGLFPFLVKKAVDWMSSSPDAKKENDVTDLTDNSS